MAQSVGLARIPGLVGGSISRVVWPGAAPECAASPAFATAAYRMGIEHSGGQAQRKGGAEDV